MVSANFIIGIVCGGIIVVSLMFWILPVQSIPPTNAFSQIIVNGEPINADSYNSNLIINFTGSLDMESSNGNLIIKLSEITCPFLQAVKGVDENGDFICGTL